MIKKNKEKEAKKDFYNRIQYMIIRYTGEYKLKKYGEEGIHQSHYEKDFINEEIKYYRLLVKLEPIFKEIKKQYSFIKEQRVYFRYLKKYLKSVKYIENIGKKEGFIKAKEYFYKIWDKADEYMYKYGKYENKKNNFIYNKDAPLTKDKCIKYLKAYILENHQSFKGGELLILLNKLEKNL